MNYLEKLRHLDLKFILLNQNLPLVIIIHIILNPITLVKAIFSKIFIF